MTVIGYENALAANKLRESSPECVGNLGDRSVALVSKGSFFQGRVGRMIRVCRYTGLITVEFMGSGGRLVEIPVRPDELEPVGREDRPLSLQSHLPSRDPAIPCGGFFRSLPWIGKLLNFW
jgi:hypothetical protein